MTNFYDLDITTTSIFWGAVDVQTTLRVQGVDVGAWLLTAPSASAMTSMNLRLNTVEAASSSYVPSASGAAMASRIATLETGASAAIAASRLPKAVLPANGLITLLTDLTTQVNAIKSALVSAGYATIAP